MKNLILVISFFLLSIPISASHVVGGDIHIQWISQNTYHLKLRAYRDHVNGIGMPTSITIGVYDAVTHQLVVSQILYPTSQGLVTLGDPCYTPDPNVVAIEEAVFESPSNIAIPDNPNGYYLNAQVNARNALAINVPNYGTMVWFAMMSDPALGQNSSPDFGNYPADAYFCVNNIKQFNFPITDPDGDSLVYSLVEPLDAISASNGTSPGAGAYPFYPGLGWQAGYSINNIIGGTPAMSIDPTTGLITASPALNGFFTYAVRVEEYRNGVKIGETRRDLQYGSLACTVASPPSIEFNDPTGLNASNDTISVYVDDLICFDLHTYDINGDTIYAQITSSDFNLIGTYVPPTAVGNNYEYTNWMNQGTPLSIPLLDTVNGFARGLGDIPTRYCWAPACEDIDTNYHVNILAYSLGCAGADTSTKDLVISVIHIPPPTLLNVPDSITLTMDEQICIDLFASDTLNINDTLYILPYSSNFDFVGTYVAPLSSAGGYYYDDFMTAGNTLTMTNYTYSGSAPGAVGEVGLRFCWTVDCDYVFQEEFDLNYMAFSSACASDTIFGTSYIKVDPPLGYVEPVPNVFTPNGDNENDCFELRGEDDPCYDVMTISIYNRWGQKVFESTDPNFCWDGTHNGSGDCSAGAYLVVIDGSYGSTYNPSNGERVPSLVKDEYMIQLLR
mgnify:CR=1 FL=1